MNHSVKVIAENYETIYEARKKDSKKFVAKEFIEFAKNNIDKYGLILLDNDLLVSTWHSDSLVKDYLSQL